MSTSQSTPASQATKSQVDAAAVALESLSASSSTSQQRNNAVQVDEVDDEDEEDDEQGGLLQDGQDGQAGTSASAAKKKKKKSKSKGKGKAAMDKLKGVLAGSAGSSDGGDSLLAPSVAGKKSTPAISDDLYKRIVAEARKNLPEDEVAKLDRQAVTEMVECEKEAYDSLNGVQR